MNKKVIFLIGPTASGKTAVALKLAPKINAEIVSCDSMQVYRGMDVITSKPSSTVCKKVAHHLLDVVNPGQEYDVSRYRREALKAIKLIHKKGKVPLLVGGTGLYMLILLDGIFEMRQDKFIRQNLYKESENYGIEHLYRRLKDVDSEAASKIHPHDKKRIIRALEVFEISGKPISLLQKQRKGIAGQYDVRIFGLNLNRDELYKRIDARVETMFNKGLLKEVKKLLKLKLSRTAAYAIGLKELQGYFDGAYDLNQAKELMQKNTRNYAKRQLTWFRKDKRIMWVNIAENETPDCIAKRILQRI